MKANLSSCHIKSGGLDRVMLNQPTCPINRIIGQVAPAPKSRFRAGQKYSLKLVHKTLRAQGHSIREIAGELGYSRGLVHKTLANGRRLGVANGAD